MIYFIIYTMAQEFMPCIGTLAQLAQSWHFCFSKIAQ
jgi:hypothetical protein